MNNFKLFGSLSKKSQRWYTSSMIMISVLEQNEVAMFSNDTSSSARILMLFSDIVSINFFFWTYFIWFCFRLFYLLTRFLPLEPWRVESSVSPCVLFSSVFGFQMLWMLANVSKLKKHITCHGSHTSQITT